MVTSVVFSGIQFYFWRKSLSSNKWDSYGNQNGTLLCQHFYGGPRRTITVALLDRGGSIKEVHFGFRHFVCEFYRRMDTVGMFEKFIKLAPSYANIFMGDLEEWLLLSSLKQPLSWFRFIDDVDMKWIHREVPSIVTSVVFSGIVKFSIFFK
jgi:hypothetical protein